MAASHLTLKLKSDFFVRAKACEVRRSGAKRKLSLNPRRCLGGVIANALLGTMEADYAAAQERLSQASVDEPSLAKVERDTQQLPQASGRAESDGLP